MRKCQFETIKESGTTPATTSTTKEYKNELHCLKYEVKKLKTQINSNFNSNSIFEMDTELFDKNRKKGVNDNYICELIQNDSIEEFVSYVNRLNMPLTSKFKHSIFESKMSKKSNEKKKKSYLFSFLNSKR